CLGSGLCGRPAPTTTTTSTTTTPAPLPSVTKCKFHYALQRINAYRAAVANGVMSTRETELPGCTTMFALVSVFNIIEFRVLEETAHT
ncbi:hypothetical protein GCK32_013871, partial [Trichostrongylus colubriformis]